MGVLRTGREDDALGIAQRLGRSIRAVGLLAAIAVAVAITTSVLELVVYQHQTDRDVDSQSAARLELQGMLEQQAGLRGYLLAGDSSLLDTYRAGQHDAASGDTAVVSLVGSNSDLTPLVAMARGTEAAWIAWARPLAAAPLPAGGVPTPVLETGAHLFDSYRAAADRMIAGLAAQYATDRHNESVVVAVAGALRVALFALLLALLVREQRRLRQALVAPFSALLRTMRVVRDGDLSARAVEQGPAELRQVAVGLNEMTHALAEERSRRASRETEVMYQATRLSEMLEMARNLAGSLNLRYVLDAASTHAVSVSGHQQATIWLAEEQPQRLVATITATAAGTGEVARPTLEPGQGTVGKAARTGRVAVGEGGTDVDPPEARAVMAVPMIVGAHVVGVIELSSAHRHVVPGSSLSLLETLASHSGTAIEAARLHARTEELTQVDALTRLFNRRRLETDLDREYVRSRRYDRPLAFCMLDVDHFKRFNDQHGHRRGDEALREVGDLLRAGIRGSDSAYRYGGEEFALLLRDTTLGAAVALCERLRVRIADSLPGTHGITASFGVTALSAEMQTPADFIEAADRALYQAKSAGRDRVIATAGSRQGG